MAGLPCSVPLCTYTTDTQCPPEQPFADKLALLQIHADSAHATPAPATLRAPQSRVCQYKFKCSACQVVNDYSEEMILDKLMRGIGDKEILADPLGDTKTDRTLVEAVEFIARKEQAKQEQGTVSSESTGAVRQTPTTPPRGNQPTTCWACQQPSHGPNTFKTRQEKCPAWKVTCDRCSTKGHFTQACSECANCIAWGHKSKRSKKCAKSKEESDEIGRLTQTINLAFIG